MREVALAIRRMYCKREIIVSIIVLHIVYVAKGKAYIGITCGQEVLFRNNLLDACSLFLGRCRRVGAVLSQRHAGYGRVRPGLTVDTIDGGRYHGRFWD